MCNPAIAIAMTVASAAMSAYGSYAQGKAAVTAGKENAKIMKEEAAAVRESAAYDAQLIRERYARTQAAQRAGYGASGVALEGTPLDVLARTGYEGERDALNTLYGGELKAKALYSGASLAQFQGQSTGAASYTQAGSTLLGAAASVYGKGYDYGMWGQKPATP